MHSSSRRAALSTTAIIVAVAASVACTTAGQPGDDVTTDASTSLDAAMDAGAASSPLPAVPPDARAEGDGGVSDGSAVVDGSKPLVDPGSIPGLGLWLSADVGVTATGTNVTAWQDRAAGVGLTTVNPPSVAAGAINGRTAISFGAMQSMQGTFGAASFTFHGLTILSVTRMAQTTPTAGGRLLALSGSGQFFGFVRSGASPYFYGSPSFSATPSVEYSWQAKPTDTTFAPGVAHQLTLRAGVGGGELLELRVDGTLTPAGRASAFGVYPNPMSGLILGSWQDGSAHDAFHGVVGELFVYRRALTATEIATLENYLRARWGTP